MFDLISKVEDIVNFLAWFKPSQFSHSPFSRNPQVTLKRNPNSKWRKLWISCFCESDMSLYKWSVPWNYEDPWILKLFKDISSFDKFQGPGFLIKLVQSVTMLLWLPIIVILLEELVFITGFNPYICTQPINKFNCTFSYNEETMSYEVNITRFRNINFQFYWINIFYFNYIELQMLMFEIFENFFVCFNFQTKFSHV